MTNSEWSRRYLPGGTDKAIKMAGSTVDKKTWRYLSGETDKAGRI